MTISSDEAKRASRKPADVPIEKGVAVISGNHFDRGLGFWSKCASEAAEKLFHSRESRDAAVAKATRYAKDVLRAKTVRVLD